MKGKKKDGKQKPKTPAQFNGSEGPRRKRLKPADKSKYKISRYQYSDDPEEDDDTLYDHLDDED